jgi:hypothetical protein
VSFSIGRRQLDDVRTREPLTLLVEKFKRPLKTRRLGSARAYLFEKLPRPATIYRVGEVLRIPVQ